MGSTTWNDSRFGPGSYEHASQEDRSAPRASVHISAFLRLSGARGYHTIMRDLALGGFTATAPMRLEEQSICWLTIPDFSPIKGQVVWWEAGIAGIAFANLLERDIFDAIVEQHRHPGSEG